jgi:hypothetical protein
MIVEFVCFGFLVFGILTIKLCDDPVFLCDEPPEDDTLLSKHV